MERQLCRENYRNAHMNTESDMFCYIMENKTHLHCHSMLENPNLTPERFQALCKGWSPVLYLRKTIYRLLSLEQVEELKDHPRFSWDFASLRFVLSHEFLRRYTEKLNWNNISMNTTITGEFIELYIDKINFRELSQNKAMTPELVDKYADRLDWAFVSSFIFLTPYLIEKYSDKINWCWIGGNESMMDTKHTLELFEKYGDKLYRFQRIWRSPRLTEELIEKHMDRNGLSANPLIIPRYVESMNACMNLNLLWFSQNPGLTIEIIRLYKDRLSWEDLSENPCITDEIVDEFAIYICFSKLSGNVSLTPYMMEKYKDLLDWQKVSENPCLTRELIEKYRDDLDWFCIFRNPFLMSDEYCDRKVAEEKRREMTVFCIEKSKVIANSGLLEWKLVNILNGMLY